MDWNQLRDAWQQQAEPQGAGEMRPKRLHRLWVRVGRRDLLETAVAVIRLPIFGLAAWWLARDGLWVAAGFALFLIFAIAAVPLRLRHARRRIPRPDPQMSVLQFLRKEREALIVQGRMLTAVARWYWGPLGVGVSGLFVSIRGADWVSVAYVGLVALMCAGVEYANRAAVRKQIRPALAALDEQIEQLENPGDEHAEKN
jgi:hypothetical protein